MPHLYHLTLSSRNSKTGPIPVSTSSYSTCPDACPLKQNGCYADSGPLAIHWKAVSEKGRGYSLDELCQKISQLPRGQLWRLNQAGDLPGHDDCIDAGALEQLVEANQGRRGFGYTHYPALHPPNARAIAQANAAGLTINLSADNLAQADELSRLRIAPVVVILPPSQAKATKTPEGRTVAICPAYLSSTVNCANCGICATHRRAIIGFPAHGRDAEKVRRVFMMQPV